MNVFNSAKKVYIGNREVKTIYSNNKKIYQKFDVLANFGTSFFNLDSEYTDPSTTQTSNYVEFPLVAGLALLTFPFAGAFSQTLNLSGYDSYYFLINKTTTSTVTSNIPGLGIFRSGGEFVTRLYSSDFQLAMSNGGTTYDVGYNIQLCPLQIGIGGDDVPLSAVGGWDFIFNPGTTDGPTTDRYRVYSIVGVKNT